MSGRMLTVTGPCPGCRRGVELEVSSLRGSPACPGCGAEILVQRSDRLLHEGVVDRCLLCAESRLYQERDLDRRRLLAAAVAGAAVAAAVSWWLAAWWPLAAAAVSAAGAGWLLARSPRLTVCYRCRAVYRGGAENRDLRAFQPALAARVEASAGGREHS